MNSFARTAALATLAVVFAAGAAAQPGPPSQPSIATLSGDLLRIEHQGRVTVALATPEGTLLADPLSLETARAIKAQFDVRFSGRPVKYVVYTDHHFERASGASVFSSTAEIFAHEAFNRERRAAAQRRPPGESSGGPTQTELYQPVLSPARTFRRTHEITLGGQTVALFHVDLHTPDMTVLLFPAQRVLFVGEAVPLDSAPESVGPAGVERATESLRLLETLDFDQIVTGNGRVGSKADVAQLRAYFEDLASGVKRGFAGGQSVEQLTATLMLPQHANLPGFVTGRPRHIAEVFATQPKQRADLYGAVHLFALQANTACMPYCSVSGAALGSTVGFNYQIGRARFAAELAASRPLTHTLQGDVRLRFDPLESRQYTLQRVDQATTFLGGFVLVDRDVRITAEGGLSMMRITVGTTILEPFTSLNFLEETTTATAVTFGTQVLAPVTKRFGVVMPVRFYYFSPAPYNTGKLTFTGGVGLSVSLNSKG